MSESNVEKVKRYELVRLDIDEETNQPLYARLGVHDTAKEALTQLRDLASGGVDISTELFSIIRVVEPPFKTFVQTKAVVKFPGLGEAPSRRRRAKAEPPFEQGA